MKLFKILTVAVLCSSASNSAFAALAQGTTGSTSTGSFDVEMTITEELKVSELVNTPMAGTGTNTGAFYVPGGGDMVSVAPACFFYNNSNTINVQLDSANGAGAGFALELAGETIPYTVEVKPDESAAAGTEVAHADGAVAAYAVKANPNNDDCDFASGNKYTSEIISTVADTGLPIAVANGTYTDTITITLTP